MSIEQLINDLANGDTAKAQDSLNSVLASKASTALDTHKIEVASQFNQQENTTEE